MLRGGSKASFGVIDGSLSHTYTLNYLAQFGVAWAGNFGRQRLPCLFRFWLGCLDQGMTLVCHSLSSSTLEKRFLCAREGLNFFPFVKRWWWLRRERKTLEFNACHKYA